MTANVNETKLLADKYFGFLVTDYAFEIIPAFNVAYETIFGYRKGNIEVDFACESDGTSLPSVTLKKYEAKDIIERSTPCEYYHLTEIESSEALKKILSRRADRYFPTGSESDYREHGRSELELLIKETAEIIKRHPEILRGKLSAIPGWRKKHNFFQRLKHFCSNR